MVVEARTLEFSPAHLLAGKRGAPSPSAVPSPSGEAFSKDARVDEGVIGMIEGFTLDMPVYSPLSR